MSEEMVSLNKFLEEMVNVIDQRLQKQEREIFTLQKKVNVLERVLKDINTGKVRGSILDQLKK